MITTPEKKKSHKLSETEKLLSSEQIQGLAKMTVSPLPEIDEEEEPWLVTDGLEPLESVPDLPTQRENKSMKTKKPKFTPMAKSAVVEDDDFSSTLP